ncbi:MAG TPA: alpha/beta hydrolase [Sphingomonas sp.]|nr:alpha/beta hydrolase [Sphingomonas sp.]
MRLPTFLLPAALLLSGTAMAQAAPEKPVIVLVHGAFAESSSWEDVIARLEKDGYTVIAAANPLRGVASDGAAVSNVVRSVKGPVVLVGHSYGGPVITEAANGNANIKALVYVAGFAPETGESSATLSTKFPDSTLGDALRPVPLADGGQDLYIQTAKFHAQFAADVPAGKAAIMAATQRPITLAALQEPTGKPAWKALPSYMIYGTADRNIPAAVMKFMAERAHARKTVEVAGGSHALMVSHPAEVTAMIEAAATGN